MMRVEAKDLSDIGALDYYGQPLSLPAKSTSQTFASQLEQPSHALP